MCSDSRAQLTVVLFEHRRLMFPLWSVIVVEALLHCLNCFCPFSSPAWTSSGFEDASVVVCVRVCEEGLHKEESETLVKMWEETKQMFTSSRRERHQNSTPVSARRLLSNRHLQQPPHYTNSPKQNRGSSPVKVSKMSFLSFLYLAMNITTFTGT